MKRLSLILISLHIFICATAQQLSRAYLLYIETYNEWAVEQMHQYRIPASITLAQGLLESRAGQSRLAVEANNHFGIKVSSGWTGPYIRENDDAPQEKFRKYASARESYIDHSIFLTRQPRYASLFQLDITDYRGWAHGLKRCGYATSPTYAQSLIRIIELYQLHRFDVMPNAASAVVTPEQISVATANEHGVYMNNDNYYVIAQHGDTFEQIACETGVSPSKLRRYNELPKDYVLQEGDIIYLQSKRNKAAPQYAGYRHIVDAGESMHTIAQLYGVKLKSLYRLNAKPNDYVPQVGDILWVR